VEWYPQCPERVSYEQEISRLIEQKLRRQPDLICLAGYDQWLTDWTVENTIPAFLYPPGDTTRDMTPALDTGSQSDIAGDKVIRSTLFVVIKARLSPFWSSQPL